MSLFTHDSLAGGRYLVTGASSGIGRATAQLIAACGGSVIANGRDTARLQETVDGLAGAGHVASAAALLDADQSADWVKQLVGAHGPLSGVFHAAGVELIRPIRMSKQAHIDEVMGASLFAAAGIARACAQKGAMVDGGAIVLMSSVAGSSGQSGMALYSAAKAAIDGMVRSLACEFAPRAIRVNAIAAGAVQTAMHERLTSGAPEAANAAYEHSHPLGFGAANDVANAALFLLSSGGRWITGTSMVVDGGYLCR